MLKQVEDPQHQSYVVYGNHVLILCGDSLYAYEGFFVDCKEKKWKYILRYKEGSMPSIYGEYRALKEREGNARKKEGISAGNAAAQKFPSAGR